jgi:dihydrofolate synthase/folylpolyglutamate synthase
MELGLLGEHQRENAQIAINVIRSLRYDYGFSIADEAVIEGLQNARHPGRLERIGQFLLDGAHNVGGAHALRNFLEEFVPQPITMIFGSMADKDAQNLLAILAPKSDLLILTQPNNSRARLPHDLLVAVPDDVDRENVLLIEKPQDAIAIAVERTDNGGIILVTGSLYLVGEVRRMLTANLSDKLKTGN